jgi:tetratricopeptide (TPR) repeat protein
MSDPLRTDPPRAPEADADRDAKIEQLLLLGLDQYFAGNYEQAINIWTRALFFDRGHPRARAYIERARTALAERQRESDELLHSGLAAFERGESSEARRLLKTAIGRGAPSEEALAVLDRIERLDQGGAPTAAADAPAARALRTARADAADAPRRSRVVVAAVTLLAVAAAAAGLFAWRRGQPRALPAPGRVLGVLSLLDRASAPTTSPDPPEGGLALPRRGEMALARAQRLQASGHLHDALAALDGVRPTDPERGEADRLRGEIERQLLAIAPVAPAGRVP